MDSGSKKSSFLVQGSILAVASIVSRMIGLVYRVVVTNILGDIGNDYYSCAFSVYSIMLTISSFSLPLAVSKLISSRVAKKEYKNVSKILRCALIFGLISGLIVGGICFFGADYITAEIMNTPMSALALRILAPTLVIVAIMGVLRGFFQGLGTMIPTATSQIIEQIINAGGSIIFALTFSGYGLEIGKAFNDPENYKAAYGAAGSTLGTSIGALAGLLFLVLVLVSYFPRLRKGTIRDVTKYRNTEKYSYIVKLMFLTIIPVLLSTTVYQLSDFLDQSIYKKIMALLNYSATDTSINWGIYSGRCLVLISIPITIANSVSASVIPSLTAAIAEGDHRLVRHKINLAIRFVMIIAFPCAVGMGVLSSPILQLLYHDSRELPASLITIASLSIVFYSLSTLTNGILQGVDKLMAPVRNALISLVLHIITLVVCMFFFDLNIYAVVVSNIIFPLSVTVLNGLSIKSHLSYRQEIYRTFIIPAISSAIMGGIIFGLYRLIMHFAAANALATIVSIIVAIPVYFMFLIGLRGITERELRELPKGRKLLQIAKKLHLM